jgi:hypothetical protein
VVEAQVRLEAAQKKYGWNLDDLNLTKEYDVDDMYVYTHGSKRSFEVE